MYNIELTWHQSWSRNSRFLFEYFELNNSEKVKFKILRMIKLSLKTKCYNNFGDNIQHFQKHYYELISFG